MWQSRVEIEDYSIAYFDQIAVFEVPYRWTSVKGGAHMCFIDSLDIHTSTRFVDAWIANDSTKRVWAPPLTEV